jgi:hypothetical protein
MHNISVDHDDIDALAEAVDTGTLPAQDLLRSLVAAIRTVADGEESTITVNVNVRTLGDTFDAAFDAEPESADTTTAQGVVRVVVAKITR